MKTFAMMALAAIAATALLINSCSKYDQSEPEKQKNLKFVEFTPDESLVPAIVQNFNQKYADFQKGYKNGEYLSLNEAIWTLEAGVNVEFTDTRDSIVNLLEDSIQITLPIEFTTENEPLVSLDDVFDVYEIFINATESFLNEGENVNQFILADVELKSINSSNTNLSFTLLGGLYSPYNCDIDDNNDYWYLFDGLGRCNELTPEYTGLDAMHRLDNLMNCAQPYCSAGTPVYYGIVTYEIPGLLSGLVDDCESPEYLELDLEYNIDEMNFYKPSGKSYLNCNSYQDIITSYPDVIWGQMMVIRYGNWYCQGGGD